MYYGVLVVIFKNNGKLQGENCSRSRKRQACLTTLFSRTPIIMTPTALHIIFTQSLFIHTFFRQRRTIIMVSDILNLGFTRLNASEMKDEWVGFFSSSIYSSHFCAHFKTGCLECIYACCKNTSANIVTVKRNFKLVATYLHYVDCKPFDTLQYDDQK